MARRFVRRWRGICVVVAVLVVAIAALWWATRPSAAARAASACGDIETQLGDPTTQDVERALQAARRDAADAARSNPRWAPIETYVNALWQAERKAGFMLSSAPDTPSPSIGRLCEQAGTKP